MQFYSESFSRLAVARNCQRICEPKYLCMFLYLCYGTVGLDMRYKHITGIGPIKEAMAQIALVQAEEKNKKDVLQYASDPEQTTFVPLQPDETGLSRTIWVSENIQFPYLIVAKNTKKVSWVTSTNAIVLPFNGASLQFEDVNTWVKNNRELLISLADRSIDIVDFFEKTIRFKNKEAKHLQEMVSVIGKRWNLPYDVFCSPGTGTNNTKLPHDIRVKVQTPNGMINIALRPNIRYEPENQKYTLPPKDYNDITKWMRLNSKAITDYWDEKITTKVFMSRLKPLP